MSAFSTDKNNVFFGEVGYRFLNEFLSQDSVSKVFVLCDENTHTQCIPSLFQQICETVKAEIIEIESGEENKEIATCQQLWATLTDIGADRHSVLINLGGGVITDMGGFVASTFLRGIKFINIPTTLLGMVDAAIGGKTGVNQKGLKNQIGGFNFPELTIIDIRFLGSLPQRQLKSGLAEMLKHGLIADKSYWEDLSDLQQLTLADLEDLIKKSIQIKIIITESDETEKGLRKKLNFGHTLGHAIESYCLKNPKKETLLHGEAIAIGMILESFLSIKKGRLTEEKVKVIKHNILHTFAKSKFSQTDIKEIVDLLKFDKKNKNGKTNFVLLACIGKARIDCQVPKELMYKAFEFYLADD